VSSCGRRIAKAYDGVTVVKYLYDGDHCIAEYDPGAPGRKYIYGPGVDQPVCMIDVNDSNAVYYYHYDGLGSVVALSDAAGDLHRPPLRHRHRTLLLPRAILQPLHRPLPPNRPHRIRRRDESVSLLSE